MHGAVGKGKDERNEDIWKEANMYTMAEFLREKRLTCFGQVQRRGEDCSVSWQVRHRAVVQGNLLST